MAATETKAFYSEKMQALLRDAEGQIKKMGVQLDHVKSDARVEYQRSVKELRSKVAAAQTKLQQLQSADEAEWEMNEADIESSWNDVKQSIQKTASQFRNG